MAQGHNYFPTLNLGNANVLSTSVIGGTGGVNDRLAWLITIPSGSTIARVGVVVTALTNANASQVFRGRFEGITAATGLPDGTVKYTQSANYTGADWTGLAANGIMWFTPTTAWTPTAGETCWFVVEITTQTSTDDVTIGNIGAALERPAVIKCWQNTGTWSAITNVTPNILIDYGTNSFKYMVGAGSLNTGALYNSATNAGVSFLAPAAGGNFCGVTGHMRMNNGGDYRFRLYSGTTVATDEVSASTLTTFGMSSNTDYGPFEIGMPPVALTAGQRYYLMIDGTANVFSSRWTVHNNAALTQMFGNSDTYFCSGNTTIATVTTDWIPIAPVFDGLPTAGGGGSASILGQIGLSGGLQ